MAYSEAAYKYFYKAFYGKINKKKNELQIINYNIRYTNVIALQDTIIIAKILVKNAKKKSLLLICLMQRLCGYVVQQIYC